MDGRREAVEAAEAIMKSLLAMEFVSKLGFNLRSPAKNATQGLLNIVEFGPSMILQSRNFYKNNKTIKRLVEDMMEDAGFLFADDAAPELVEGQMRGKDFTQKIKITDKEEIEYNNSRLLTLLNYSICLKRLKNYSDAHNNLRQALQLDPTNVKAMYHKGQIYRINDEFEKSKEILSKALKLDE